MYLAQVLPVSPLVNHLWSSGIPDLLNDINHRLHDESCCNSHLFFLLTLDCMFPAGLICLYMAA